MANPVIHPDRFYIGGEWAEPSSDAVIEVVNCASEEVFFRVAEAQEADIERAVAAARKAFDEGPWPAMTPAERAGYLRAIAAEFDKRAELSARIFTTKSGMIHGSSMARAASLGNDYRYYADLAGRFAFIEEHKPKFGNLGLIVREPVGVVGAIIPWNSPAGLIANKCAPALLAGCCLIVKVSPEAPGAGYVLAEVCEAVGLPPGVVNVVTADREVSELLVRIPASTRSPLPVRPPRAAASPRCAASASRVARSNGRQVAGYRPRRLRHRGGGQSPRRHGDFSTGQGCSLLTRVIVTRRRHDAMVEALSAAFEKVTVGDPSIRRSGWAPWRWRASASASKAISPRELPKARPWKPAAGDRHTSTADFSSSRPSSAMSTTMQP